MPSTLIDSLLIVANMLTLLDSDWDMYIQYHGEHGLTINIVIYTLAAS